MTALIADVLVLFSLVVLTVAVAGLVRLPTVALRLHASAKAAAFGVVPLSVAAAVAGPGAHALLVGVFLVVTAPVASHAIARAARRTEEGTPGELYD